MRGARKPVERADFVVVTNTALAPPSKHRMKE